MTKLIFAPKVAALISPDEAEQHATLRAAAETVIAAEGAFIGHDLMHLENILAYAAQNALHKDSENAILRDLEMDSWPMIQSPIGLRNKYLRAIDWADINLCDLIQEIVAERRRADALHAGEASEMLRKQVARLGDKYPELGLTFGYIGNCDLGVGQRYDDRSWKVFTKLATAMSQCSDVSWGGYSTATLGRMALLAEKELTEWCADKSRQLKEGNLRSLARKAA